MRWTWESNVPVPAHDDLRVRTPTRRLAHQSRERRAPTDTPTHQVARDVGRVVDALHGNVAVADDGAQSVEERRAREDAHVAELRRAPREDYRDGLAGARQVVARRGEGLALLEGVG